MLFLHFSFLLPLIEAFMCLFFYHFYHYQLFLPAPVIIVPVLSQLPLLLPIAFVSLPVSLAPALTLLAFLKSPLIYSLFLQLVVSVVKPILVILADILVFQGFAAPIEAVAAPVRDQAITDAMLLILIISIGLRHYYQKPFSSFSFSFFSLLKLFIFQDHFHNHVWDNLVNLLRFQEVRFVAIIRFLGVFVLIFSLGNFAQEATNFIKVMSKFLQFHLNHPNHLNFDHFMTN
jgi:hypothetical protein